MASTHWEVEQKFRLPNRQATTERLNELGVAWLPPIQQVDRYFNHPARDFGESDEALRLRQVQTENCITYKGPKIDPATKTRRELELPLPAGSGVPDQFGELLLALGFRAVATVEKSRRPGSLRWEAFDVEVALDEVRGAGSFLELEISAANETLKAAQQALHSLSARLGLREVERRSYLEMILESRT